MVIVRLGDIVTPEMAPQLLAEATKLDNYGEWRQAEREFRLCKSLRVALRESEGLTARSSRATSRLHRPTYDSYAAPIAQTSRASRSSAMLVPPRATAHSRMRAEI